MSIQGLDNAFQAHCDKRIARGQAEEYCLSLSAVEGLTLDEIAFHAKRPNAMLRPSTVEALDAAGFTIEETPGRRDKDGHCDAFLKTGKDHKPDVFDLLRLQGAFGAAFKNPNPVRGQQ